MIAFLLAIMAAWLLGFTLAGLVYAWRTWRRRRAVHLARRDGYCDPHPLRPGIH